MTQEESIAITSPQTSEPGILNWLARHSGAAAPLAFTLALGGCASQAADGSTSPEYSVCAPESAEANGQTLDPIPETQETPFNDYPMRINPLGIDPKSPDSISAPDDDKDFFVLANLGPKDAIENSPDVFNIDPTKRIAYGLWLIEQYGLADILPDIPALPAGYSPEDKEAFFKKYADLDTVQKTFPPELLAAFTNAATYIAPLAMTAADLACGAKRDQQKATYQPVGTHAAIATRLLLPPDRASSLPTEGEEDVEKFVRDYLYNQGVGSQYVEAQSRSAYPGEFRWQRELTLSVIDELYLYKGRESVSDIPRNWSELIAQADKEGLSELSPLLPSKAFEPNYFTGTMKDGSPISVISVPVRDKSKQIKTTDKITSYATWVISPVTMPDGSIRLVPTLVDRVDTDK